MVYFCCLSRGVQVVGFVTVTQLLFLGKKECQPKNCLHQDGLWAGRRAPQVVVEKSSWTWVWECAVDRRPPPTVSSSAPAPSSSVTDCHRDMQANKPSVINKWMYAFGHGVYHRNSKLAQGVLLCRPGWPEPHRNTLTSTSQVVGLKTHVHQEFT